MTRHKPATTIKAMRLLRRMGCKVRRIKVVDFCYLVAMIVYRNLRRNTAFSLLNILGLAVGLAASILIFLVIRWETSYDSYHPNKDRVYRVVTTLVNRSNGEVAERHGSAPIVLGDAVRNEVSGLEKTAMLLHLTNASIYYRDKG